MILYAVLMATNVATPGAFLREAGVQLVIISMLWRSISSIVRFNVMGYFLLAAMITLVSGALDLIGAADQSSTKMVTPSRRSQSRSLHGR